MQPGVPEPTDFWTGDNARARCVPLAITVASVWYNFEVRLFIECNGSYFVANIARLEPVEWQAGMWVA